ncbi:MAG: bifunctional folylpolyglutamate synthase/dihydrofolate synthase [Hyphomicrobiaceae bacterium]|nr:bifunctional folylpolyglutamate synthase/dihydrofolate synthase [Hyphomicrobiaceae bacterium]MCC0023973.1 bifunctional folylpolyglutamate synthase/dihydrofolate synthase [Hyphomicrobiaceae bacterium]
MKTDAILRRILDLHPNKLIDLSLGRIVRLLDDLGRPQDRLPPVIHVAGTNGKGSTIAFMRAILEAADKTVHVYTSPHLVQFRERIRLAGKLVSARRLNKALERCEEVNRGQPITYFELTTAAALLLFSEIRADYLLLEVGLGGRYDATNVIDHPLGSVITPVDLDHQDFLGDNLFKIATEKAGILKAGSKAAIARQHPDAEAAIEDIALGLGIQAQWAGEHFDGYEQAGRFVFQNDEGLMDLPLPALAGPFQIANATLAIGALLHFGTGVSEEQIAAGMKRVQWPGRMMPIRSGKLFDLLPEGSELWIDGGHNPSGGKVLADAMLALDRRAPRPLVMVWATFRNKDARGYIEPFASLGPRVLTLSMNDERASYPAEELAAICAEKGLPATKTDNLAAALTAAAAYGPARFLVCGSLHLIGEFLEANGTTLD